LLAAGQYAAAVEQLQRAIDLGHLPSRALKAWLLITGRKGVAKDMERGFEFAEEGARLGCHHCQGVMAYCYSQGFGCDIDDVRSPELARKSSRRGSRYGQLTLGNLHKDNAQADSLYQLAAAQGLDVAQCRLGDMCDRLKDHAEALRWYKLAAAQGNPEALGTVAQRYDDGYVVAVDEAEAIRWYKRAQAAGDLDSDAVLRSKLGPGWMQA
jgi:TPR repeat protein